MLQGIKTAIRVKAAANMLIVLLAALVAGLIVRI
jgi:hypothetical protein